MLGRVAAFYLVAMVFLGWGFAIGAYHVFPWDEIQPFKAEVEEFLAGDPYGQDKSLLERLLDHPQKIPPDPRFEGQAGFRIYDPGFTDNGYLLLSRFSDTHEQSIVELVRLSDRAVIHTWRPDIPRIAELSPSEKSGVQQFKSVERYRIGHPLLLADGGLLFHNFEGPLVRIDACNGIGWVIDEHFHHSIERGPDGTFWVPTVIEPSSIRSAHRDDAIAHVSRDGRVISRISVTKLLEENGYQGLVYGVGAEDDPIHLNDVQPVMTGEGNNAVLTLLLSMRHRSTVAQYRPDTGKVLWSKTGPWLNQHDINVLGEGRFSIFGNDIMRYSRAADKGAMYYDEVSQVYVYNPSSGEITTPYETVMRAHEIRSATEGRSRILDNGDAFIEESNAARLLRVSPDSVRWSYVNRMENGGLGLVHWSRYLYERDIEQALAAIKGQSCEGGSP